MPLTLPEVSFVAQSMRSFHVFGGLAGSSPAAFARSVLMYSTVDGSTSIG